MGLTPEKGHDDADDDDAGEGVDSGHDGDEAGVDDSSLEPFFRESHRSGIKWSGALTYSCILHIT